MICQPPRCCSINRGNSSPDIFAQEQIVATGGEGTQKGEYKTMWRFTQHLQAMGGTSLNYVSLNLESAKLVLFTDA